MTSRHCVVGSNDSTHAMNLSPSPARLLCKLGSEASLKAKANFPIPTKENAIGYAKQWDTNKNPWIAQNGDVKNAKIKVLQHTHTKHTCVFHDIM